MTTRKKLIISFSILFFGYYLIGFPLTLFGVVDEWPIFPGGVSVKYQGKDSSVYDGEVALPGNDGPYIFYKGDSLLIKYITGMDTFSATTEAFHKNKKNQVVIRCAFRGVSGWDFESRLKDSLTNEQTDYPDAKKILAVSDIEGNFGSFRKLLIANGVIDSAYNWTFSDGHLVLVGDFFDRGLNVTECLWLIYDLEEKAKSQGGYVHFILGNHEIMNMTGDFRYVRKKYMANSELLNLGYGDLYKPSTALGQWLASKNIIEKIGGIIFVHGGISQDVHDLQLSLTQINSAARPHYFSPSKTLPAGDIVVSTLFNSKHSPFWNRDFVEEGTDEHFIDAVLKENYSEAIVVGHTMVNEVKTLYSGKVVAIDTKHAENNSQGLLIENGSYFRIDDTGTKLKIK